MADKKYFPIKTATACQLKWTWTTLWLKSGDTWSCHRAGESKLSLDNFDNFHNTPTKIRDRELMLQGEWPGDGCEYCKRIEDAGGSSDRKLHLEIPDLTPPELESDPYATTVTPRILELYLNNTCNFSCVYCRSELSSKINSENIKFNSSFNGNADEFYTFKTVSEDIQSQYLEKFWAWMEKNSQSLKRLHILGGEPFYQREFDDVLAYFDRTPHPQLELNIITNLMISKTKLESYMEQIKTLIANKKIKRLDLSVSIDCWGKEQEFVRWGLDLSQWEENFNYLLTLPWLVLNINQTISLLTIKTMPALLEKLKEWKKKKSVQQFFSAVCPGPSYLKPYILGGDIFEEDFNRIFALMNTDTHQEKEAVKYMKGIWAEIKSSTKNDEEIDKLKIFLDEIDRRRNTNWKELFPWLK